MWRAADALQFVAGIRTAETEKLEADRVTTMAALAACTHDVADLQPRRRSRLVSQAALQVRAREMPDEAIPPHHSLPDPTPEEVAAGFAAMPAPDDGDVFLDYEGHPFWRADAGLFFLFGLLQKGADGEWVYEARWAHSKDEEGTQARALIEYFAARRQAHPDMHVYHYNHTERSALQSMAAEHGADQTLLQELVDTGLFVDLLQVVRNSLQAGVESYGLKSIERLAKFERSHEIDKGAGAVVEYDRWMHDHDGEILPRIATYNMDDVRATQVLRDWLIDEREAELAWRISSLTKAKSEKRRELDDLIDSLHTSPDGTVQHLMGDLLGYWGREGAANTAQLLAKLAQDASDLMDDPTAIAGLNSAKTVALPTPGGKVAKHGGMSFRFPPQPTAQGFVTGGEFAPSVCYSGHDGIAGWADVVEFDAEEGSITLRWNTRCQELGVMPSQLVLNEWIGPGVKTAALVELGQAINDGTAPDEVQTAILEAAPPRFTGQGPAAGVFTDDVNDTMQWVLDLDRTCVPIQGPPGTGKTWMGAHLALALVKAGRACRHHSDEPPCHRQLPARAARGLHHRRVHRPAQRGPRRGEGLDAGAPRRASCQERRGGQGRVQRGRRDDVGIRQQGDARLAGRRAHHRRGRPVGHRRCSRRLQRGRQCRAVGRPAATPAGGSGLAPRPIRCERARAHPRRGRGHGASGPRRLLDDDATDAPERVRVHLEGDLRRPSHVSRVVRRFSAPTTAPACAGCVPNTPIDRRSRWKRPSWWRTRSGSCSDRAGLIPITPNACSEPDDFMVVAPYNDQVRLMRRMFDNDPVLAGIKVGTVDKFQGQQAPVVFFTMTTSTAEDMPRGPGFLFSRNRLNVALSRAKCLAYVVCTDELLNSRAKSVDEMKLISTLCSAVDYATGCLITAPSAAGREPRRLI